MNRGGSIVTIIAALAAFPLCAQQGGTQVQPGSPAAVPVATSPTANGSQQAPASTQPATDPTAPATTAAAVDSASAEMVPVKGELVSKLDTKTAKQGDTVVVKTTETLKTVNGSEIPKGSKLMGHVTAVQPHSSQSPNSEVVLKFDQAELKGGQNMPIRSTIESVGPPEGSNTQSVNAFAGAPTPASGAAGGGSMSGSRGSAPSASSGAPVAASPSAGVNATTGSEAGGPTGTQSTAGRVVAGSGANAIRTTDIPGIYLSSNAARPESGALYAAKANVHLDSGTQIAMKVAVANPQ